MLTTELAYWINERYAMKTRRETHEKPIYKHGWSDDPAMGEVRYCNVHREDDAVTKWLAVNWRPKHHAVWEIVLARMLNYIPTLEAILHEGGPLGIPPLSVVGAALKSLRSAGEKVFTSAYTISTCGQSMDKIDYVMGVVGQAKQMWPGKHWNDHMYTGDTLESAHHDLMCVNGLGSFLAAQVVADLKNTRGHPLEKAVDWHTWAAPGPGSLRGLAAFYGRPIAPSQFTKAINECWAATKPFISPWVPPIHMQDFQNCLCEFSKYEKFKVGGHVRNHYRV